MSKRVQHYIQQAAIESYEQGERFLSPMELSQRAAALDERYMARRKGVNRLLSLVGVTRSDEPVLYPGGASFWPNIISLESQGVIIGEWLENDDRSEGAPRRRLFGIADEYLPLEPEKTV